ncbi:hypothetical protein T492DRAFT_195355 [Pavlovales sp. CCMP2436]|nr:hypothetical protein T492DRAFT_195355 [Pavlovales sp. CCMP2436]
MELPVRRISAAWCWLAYIVAFVASGLAASALDAGYPELGPLWKVNLLATCVVWCSSLAASNTSVYDPYWCLAPLLLAFY